MQEESYAGVEHVMLSKSVFSIRETGFALQPNTF